MSPDPVPLPPQPPSLSTTSPSQPPPPTVGCSSPLTTSSCFLLSPSPTLDAMDFVISSNSFGFLPPTSSDRVPSPHSLAYPQVDMADDRSLLHDDADGYRFPNRSLLSSSSLSGIMLRALQAATRMPPSPPTLLQPASPRLRSISCPPDVSGVSDGIADSSNSPTKQDSTLLLTEDSDGGLKTESRDSKRRKTQHIRVVSVPISGEGKQKGEAPPSDLWTWRKYGQKPIKGSPYPRGYYRCSCSRGCPARKQVERSRSDPNTLLITYASEHNHPWPVSSSSSSSVITTNCSSPNGVKQVQEEAVDSCDVSGNLFCSIINSPNFVDQKLFSPFVSAENDESLSLNGHVDRCLSRITTQEDQDVFNDLGELPELSAILSRGFLEERNEDYVDSIYVCDSYSISS